MSFLPGNQFPYSWIHPEYRDYSVACIGGSIVCLKTDSDTRIVLDLKGTHHTGRIMPGV